MTTISSLTKNIDSLDFLFSLQILVLSKFFSSVDLVLLFMLDAFFHVSRLILGNMLLFKLNQKS